VSVDEAFPVPAIGWHAHEDVVRWAVVVAIAPKCGVWVPCSVRCVLGTVCCPLCAVRHAVRCVLFAVRWSEARADAVLEKLPKGSVFVNVGRGDLIRSGKWGETFAL
jgi:hypothetical protein